MDLVHFLAEIERRKKYEYIRYFRPHDKQLEWLLCGKRTAFLLGGNRTGKTEAGAVRAVIYALGESIRPYLEDWPADLRDKMEPLIMRFGGGPTRGWIFSESFEVQRDVTQIKLMGDGRKPGLLPQGEIEKITYRSSGVIDTIRLKNGSVIGFKSYDQGRDKAQGTSQHWIWEDEECPEDIHSELQMRVMDTQGDIFGTMTPLQGLCFDENTEILTENGWSKWDEVRLGERAITFNMETETLEWDVIKGLYCNPDYIGPMVRMKNGGGFDAFVTPDHRWPVYSRATHKPTIKLTRELKTHHYIKNAADFDGCPTEKTFPDAFVELAGWMIGDGTFQKGKRYVKLYQSLTRYPEKCEHIRRMLTELGCDWKENRYSYSHNRPGVACHFTISGYWAEQLRKWLPGKVISPGFLVQLTKGQLWLFYKGLMDSDGSRNHLGDHFTQRKWDNIHGYQMLGVMLGLKTTATQQKDKVAVHIQRSKRYKPNTHVDALDIQEMNYKGLIWCAQTNNTTLVARRNGTVYITGNTWVYDDIYLNHQKPPEKQDPEIFCMLMSWEDNPHLSAEEIARLEASMDEAEIEARKYGRFIMPGTAVFDVTAIGEMQKQCYPGVRGNLSWLDIDEDDPEDRIALWEDDPNGLFEVWYHPNPYDEYIIAADVAEGLEHGDFSVVGVINRTHLRLDAVYHGKCDPDVLGEEIIPKLGVYYGDALAAPERNNHGLTTITALKKKYYHIYKEVKVDKKTDERRQVLGWQTSPKTRPLIIDALKKAVRTRALSCYYKRFVDEAFNFVRDKNGKEQAREGAWDDVILMMAIGVYVHSITPFKGTGSSVMAGGLPIDKKYHFDTEKGRDEDEDDLVEVPSFYG